MTTDADCLPPVAEPKKPALPTPPGACDTHFHIFGPVNRFPYAEARAYTPPEAPLEALLHLHAVLGIERGVVVQGHAHGTDNSALLDALNHEPRRLRGVAIVPPTISSAALERMTEGGVRGLRFHHIARTDKDKFSPIGIDAFLQLAPMMADLDLHLQLLADASELPEVMPRLKHWKLPIVIDHMARLAANEGVEGGGFQALRRYLAEGKIWIKLSGAYLASRSLPDYDDMQPMHEALVACNPEQLVWGTNWPHPRRVRDMPDDGHLLDVFNAWTPDAAAREKILVDNPAKLYGFRLQ